MPTGRLTARPTAPSGPTGPTGLRPLGLGDRRDGLRYVPSDLPPGHPAPLMVLFHGAGGVATNAIELLRPRADAHGLILLAPGSRGRTWDVILGEYGPDVVAIDAALEQTFASYAIDPARITFAGFSDGASYALSLGLTNGDLVAGVAAFSPGFLAPATIRGSPRIYVSHGIHDDVLPIDRCSRRIVPALEDAGYDVTYHEFDGPHTVPPEIVDEALAWLDGLAVPVATPTPYQGPNAEGAHMTDHDPQEDVSVKSGHRREDEPGSSGHPEPGSGHDDGKTETVDQGPPVEKVDGVPGAHPGRRDSNRDS